MTAISPDWHWKMEDLMYYDLFIAQTSLRALDNIFYKVTYGMDKSEMELISAEYKKAVPIVLKKEMEMSQQGWMQ